MTARRPRRAPPPPGGLLDWSDGKHWSGNRKPCRYCRELTNLRDSQRSPAHKTCAEVAIAQQAADAAAAYRTDTL